MSTLMGIIELGWRFSTVIVIVALIAAFAISEANRGPRA